MVYKIKFLKKQEFKEEMKASTDLITKDDSEALQSLTEDNNKLVEKKEEILNTEKKRALAYLMSELKIEYEEAQKILRDEHGEWEELLAIMKKRMDFEALRQADKILKKVDDKIYAGSMAQVKEGVIASNIHKQNVFPQPSSGPRFQIGGKDVSIKVNFPFKPYKK